MQFRFERFLAIRYLLSRGGRSEGSRFRRFIVAVAVGGVTVGVAALLLALSIVRGFSLEIEQKIVGFGAHIQVESYADEPISDAGAVRARLEGISGVELVAPVVQEFALLRRAAGEIDGVSIWGTAQPPAFLTERIVDGAFSFEPLPAAAGGPPRPGVVIGEELARLLDASVGDVVTAFSMRAQGDLAGALLQAPRLKQFVVSGIYETSLANFDEIYAFTDLEAAQALLDYPADRVTRFDVTVADVSRIDAIVEDVDAALGYPYIARTIYQVFSGLFAWVNLQQSIIPLVISIIILVAAFNIIGILLMIILENTRAIGVLGSMGASRRMVRRTFLVVGFLIGLVGTVLGEATAWTLAMLQQRFGIIPLPEEAYYMNTAPIEVSPFDFLWVGLVSVILCTLAAYIPARVASRIDPVRAIRFA